MGDSRRIIRSAVITLEIVLKELRCASIYETEPLYVTDQGRFLNTAVCGFFPGSEDVVSAKKLLSCVNAIEARFGRDRKNERRWGERLLDIDILLFGDLVVSEDELTIPHPRLNERRFALEPMLELLPDAVEPGTGNSYRNFFEQCIAQKVDKWVK